MSIPRNPVKRTPAEAKAMVDARIDDDIVINLKVVSLRPFRSQPTQPEFWRWLALEKKKVGRPGFKGFDENFWI